MKKSWHHKIFPLLLLIAFFFSFFYWVFNSVKTPDHIPNPPQISNNTPLEIISGNAIVIDGDTIEINKRRIRLIGIDSPETKQKCLDKNYSEYLCGEVATVFLKKLIGNKNVDCDSEGKDIYQRDLGNCKMEGININYEMVKNGMAIIYNLKDANGELKNLEAQAQNKKLGVWQGAFEEPRQYRKKNKYKHH